MLHREGNALQIAITHEGDGRSFEAIDDSLTLVDLVHHRQLHRERRVRRDRPARYLGLGAVRRGNRDGRCHRWQQLGQLITGNGAATSSSAMKGPISVGQQRQDVLYGGADNDVLYGGDNDDVPWVTRGRRADRRRA